MAKVTKKKEEVIDKVIRCKFAGDPQDEYCCTCDGVEMDIDGVLYPCDECESYEPEEEVVEEVPVNPVEQPREEVATVSVESYTPQALTTCIKAESGLSMETKKGWYRFAYVEERIVPESADLEAERRALWETVHGEVDRQAEEIKELIASS